MVVCKNESSDNDWFELKSDPTGEMNGNGYIIIMQDMN